MIVVKKKNRKAHILITMSLLLAILIIATVVINAVIAANAGEGPGTDDSGKPKIEIIEGLEDTYLNSPVAYTHVKDTSIAVINVKSADSEYTLIRDESEKDEDKAWDPEAGFDTPFILRYRDENGEMQLYYPRICEDDPSFEYEDLYSVVTDDSFGQIPKLTYLLTAIGAPYFDNRIELPKDEAERRVERERFGLGDDKTVTINFGYNDDEGNVRNHTIIIGEPIITGVGYYFMVDGRDYIYSVETNNYFQYALMDFTSFIKPVLTAPGLDIDSTFEPYLTTDFKHYKNTLHSEDGDVVTSDAKVVINASEIIPLMLSEGKDDDGYSKEIFKQIGLDLSNDTISAKRARAMLEGMKVGAFDENQLLTLFTHSRLVETSGEKTSYSYTVTAIESLLTEGSELTRDGTPVGDNTLIKVTYTVSVNGKAESTSPMHGVIDLSHAGIPESAAVALAAAAVGQLPEPISFTVDYTDGTAAHKSNIRMVLTEIIIITGEDGKTVETAKDGCRILYRYYIESDGKRIEGDFTDSIVLDPKSEGISKTLYDYLNGKSQAVGLDFEFANYTQYTEVMADFMCYEIKAIEYFVTSEMVVGFRFQQASNRNPYYGEAIYENTTEGKYSMYGLDSSVCESITKVLGGINTSATTSLGLSGIETVAVGITPEIMEKYHLYDYSVYFELPRGITSINYGDLTDEDYLDSLDDYTYYGVLGFNMYVSRVQPDGTRYVASDMYDIVAKIDADTFEFLDFGFADFYARKNLMLLSVENISSLKIDLFMEDVYGSFSNRLNHERLYAYGGKLYDKNDLTEEQLALSTKVDGVTVIVTPEGECVETEFSKYLEKNGFTFASLTEFYENKIVEGDTLGTDNFRELLSLLGYMHYEGNLTEDEQLKGAAYPMLMRMTLSLGEYDKDGSYGDYSVFDYVYEFYRISDRQVMVKLYRQNRNSPADIRESVSDFYVSTFAFKKIVNAYLGILNKELIENETPYS